jgi:hypothetical protein
MILSHLNGLTEFHAGRSDEIYAHQLLLFGQQILAFCGFSPAIYLWLADDS